MHDCNTCIHLNVCKLRPVAEAFIDNILSAIDQTQHQFQGVNIEEQFSIEFKCKDYIKATTTKKMDIWSHGKNIGYYEYEG